MADTNGGLEYKTETITTHCLPLIITVSTNEVIVSTKRLRLPGQMCDFILYFFSSRFLNIKAMLKNKGVSRGVRKKRDYFPLGTVVRYLHWRNVTLIIHIQSHSQLFSILNLY